MFDENYSAHTALADLHYLRAIGKVPEMESSKAMAKFIERFISAGDSILDVGCSAGHYLFSLFKLLPDLEFSYTGIEAHDLFLEKAEKAWKNRNSVEFRKGSIF
ncbi:MAG: class I SAM-dependent methyltransferase, partial [Candidatus Fonsibacter sp.]